MAEEAIKTTETLVRKKHTPVKDMDQFAVIETGGKQYIVCVGDTIEVELLGGLKKEHAIGEKITFDKVLMTDNGTDTTVGTPYVDGAKVTATYQGIEKGKKLSIIRFESKSNRSRKIGHRQKYAVVTIDAIG